MPDAVKCGLKNVFFGLAAMGIGALLLAIIWGVA